MIRGLLTRATLSRPPRRAITNCPPCRNAVPADNNACERALRPSVIHRKVMGSFRSDWGPRAYAVLATVLNTAKREGENVFQKLVSLMGKPVLHYLNSSIA